MKNIALICCGLILLSFDMQGQNSKYFNFHITPAATWFTTNDNLINSNGGFVNAKIGAKIEKNLKGNLYYFKGLSLAFGQGGTLRHEIGGNLLPNSELDNPELAQGDKPLGDGTDIGYKLRFLEIPLGLKYRIPTSGYSTYYIEGPLLTTHIKLGAKGTIENSTVEAIGQNVAPDVHLLNFSWGFGGGIEYNINPDFSLIAGISFHRNLFDQLKNNGTRVTSTAEGDIIDISRENSMAQMNSIQISFGILF